MGLMYESNEIMYVEKQPEGLKQIKYLTSVFFFQLGDIPHVDHGGPLGWINEQWDG